MSKHLQNVLTLLEKYKVESVDFTHTSTVPVLGKYTIEMDETYELFWTEYCKAIKKLDDPMIGIYENSKYHRPILVDIDIKIDENELDEDYVIGEPLYSDKQLLKTIEIYQKVLSDIIEDVNDEHLICFVLKKDPYIKPDGNGKRWVKNGFHLHFPYVFMSVEDISNIVLPRVKKLADDMKIFASLGVEKSGDMIDVQAATKNVWLMYGSRKSVDNNPYLLENIYDKNREEITLDDALENYKIYDCEEEEITIKGKEYELLPRILSIFPSGRTSVTIKKSVYNIVKNNIIKTQKKKFDKISDVKISEELKMAEAFINILNKERAGPRETWFEIAVILYNISHGSQEGLELFLKFSKYSSDKFDEDGCVREWSNLRLGTKGMGTLRYLAQHDSPDEYKKICAANAAQHVDKSIINNGSHNHIAKILKEMYGEVFVWVGKKEWYEFSEKEHKWVYIEDGISLRQKISDELPIIFREKHKKLNEEYIAEDEEGRRKLLESYQKTANKILIDLGNATFKNHIMTEAREVFWKKNFLEKLNTNKKILGFKNGVYDFQDDNNHHFRKGMPEDYLTKTMGIEYKEFKEGDRELELVDDFLMKIFPDRDLREFFLDNMADLCIGGNFRKKFYVWSGCGDNGKSVTQNIVEKIFGQYAVKLPVSATIGKRGQSGAANPEFARLGDGVRLVVMQEPGKGEGQLNTGLVKEMTGNDTMFCRALFENGREILPLYKPVLICNDPPNIEHSDQATWNRIRVIPFESKFVDNPPATWEEQLLKKEFPKDIHFETDKLPLLLQPFIWKVLNHLKNRKGKEVKEPALVHTYTYEYRRKNDVYRQFFTESLIKEEGKYMLFDDAYVLFKNWYKEGQPNIQLPKKSEVKEQFSKILGMEIKTKIKGYRERTEKDNMEEEDDNDK